MSFCCFPLTVTNPNWYDDSGASNHVIGDFNNLNQRVEYHGKETLNIGNGDQLDITHIGHSHLHPLFIIFPHCL